jgi:hypothetical protein
MSARILISYSVVTPESAEHGEAAEQGWINEEGVYCEPDPFERGEGQTRVDVALRYIPVFCEASSSHFHKGVWYTESDGDTDYRTGAVTTRAFHLVGFTEQEEREIFERIRADRRAPSTYAQGL